MSNDVISEFMQTATATEEIEVFLEPAPLPVPLTKEELQVKVEEITSSLVESNIADYGFARDNMRTVLEKAMTFLPTVLVAASENKDAETIKAASQYMKILSEINAGLVKLNTDAMKNNIGVGSKKSEPTGQTGGVVGNGGVQPQIVSSTTNIVFQGDASDVFDSVKNVTIDHES